MLPLLDRWHTWLLSVRLLIICSNPWTGPLEHFCVGEQSLKLILQIMVRRDDYPEYFHWLTTCQSQVAGQWACSGLSFSVRPTPLKMVTANMPRLFILLLAQHFTLLSMLNYFWLQKDKMAADKLQPKNNWWHHHHHLIYRLKKF